MPNNKKKSAINKKEKQLGRRAKQNASQDFHAAASEFRHLLLSGRQEYSKGRAYAAVDFQTQALELGSEKFLRFNDDSLVKAHALMELALAKSAIMTDFAAGEEWQRVKEEWAETSREALQIYEHRVEKGTLTKFRKEECWIDHSLGEYISPVPHTERLGPIDYVQCVYMNNGLSDPSQDTVRSIKRAINFAAKYRASGYVISLEGGGALQGGLPATETDKLSELLVRHEQVVTGQTSKEDALQDMFPHNVVSEEVRHSGSITGKMKPSHKKLAKDAEKLGYKQCENPSCTNMESHPKQYQSCSRCKGAYYCSRECQVGDWKRHKAECNSGEAAKKAEAAEMQNNMKNCLMVGQSQQILVIVRYLHHFAVTSNEMMQTKTKVAMGVQVLVAPKFRGIEFGGMQLGMQDVSLIWAAIWSMERNQRTEMFDAFARKMEKFKFPRGGPDFSVVAEWAKHGVSGNFAVVKHRKNGTILLYHDAETDAVKGYLAIGITQSLESLLAQLADPLPIYVNTALIPFKSSVLCQGTIGMADGSIGDKLQTAARAYVDGDHGDITIVESMP